MLAPGLVVVGQMPVLILLRLLIKPNRARSSLSFLEGAEMQILVFYLFS